MAGASAGLQTAQVAPVIVPLLPRPETSVSTVPLPRSKLYAATSPPAGGAPVTVKVRTADVPPPGAGVKTMTCAVPAVAISAAAICAVSWVAETKVVVRLAPFQRTTEPETKLLPPTVRTKAAPPAAAEVGASVPITGKGLPPPPDGLMVKV